MQLPQERSGNMSTDPFINLYPLLLDPQHTLPTLLDALEPNALYFHWPQSLLEQVLLRPADPVSLLRLFPTIENFAVHNREHLQRVSAVLSRYLEGIRQCRVLAAVQEVVGIWVDQVRAVQAEGGMRRKRFGHVKAGTLELVRVLRRFGRPVIPGRTAAGATHRRARKEDIPHVAKGEIERLVRVMYDVGDVMEAEHGTISRKAGQHLEHKLRRILFSTAVLTPTLREFLLTCLPHHSITTGEWHACMLSAVREGDHELVLHFRQNKLKRQALAGEWARTGQLKREAELAVDDGDDDGSQVIPAASDRTSDDTRDGQLPGVPDSTLERCVGYQSYLPAVPLTAEEAVAIDDIIALRARGQDAVPELMAAIQPYLHRTTEDVPGLDDPVSALTPYAWSILTTHLARSDNISVADLYALVQDMPREGISPHSVSPVIDGLVKKGAAQDAWRIWEEMEQLHLSQSPLLDAGANDEGRQVAVKGTDFQQVFVDEVLLAASTYACAACQGLDAAVALVDTRAARTKSDTGHRDPSRAIQLDTTNLNVLLHLCVQQQRPNLAFRLFAAALPRWGVWPDAISLNLLLDCARFAVQDTDTMSSRLRALAGGFHFRRSTDQRGESGEYGKYDAAGFAAGDTRVLLDPVDEYGNTLVQAEYNDGLRWYERGRRLMREVVLDNHPQLGSITSPLDFRGIFTSLDDILARGQLGQSARIGARDRAPLSKARYTHIIPDAVTFQAYITLLGFYNMPEEIPIALAWARDMGVEPTWRCMCSTLAFVCETEGPRRMVKGWYEREIPDDVGGLGAEGASVQDEGGEGDKQAKSGRAKRGTRLVRDEEVLRRWLEDWVEGDVPTESEVAAFIHSVRTKGGRMLA